MKSIVERLRKWTVNDNRCQLEAADLIEQQSERIDGLHVQLGLKIERIKELEAANLKLIRGDFNQMCSYCGWESPGNGDSWEELMAHIHCCDKHPLKKANDELSALRQRERDYRDVTSGCPDVLVARELLSKNFPVLFREMEARKELAALRQRIDDAPVVCIAHTRPLQGNESRPTVHAEWKFPAKGALISKEDLK